MSKRVTAEQWGERVGAWEASGLSREDFSARHGIDPKQLGWWKWRHAKKTRRLATKDASAEQQQQQPAVRLVPARLKGQGQTAKPLTELGAEVLVGTTVVRLVDGCDPAWAAGLLWHLVAEGASRC